MAEQVSDELTLAESIKLKYKSITDVPFQGCYSVTSFLLGRERHIVEVYPGGDVYNTLKDILASDPGDTIWKGITCRSGTLKLWAESVSGSGESPFKITRVELVTGLNWQENYEGLFNVTVETKPVEPSDSFDDLDV